MEELVSLGWVRSLGLSNFNSIQMQRILDNCTIKPVTNQVECHPALNQEQLRAFCKHHDIVVTAYSPLARPKTCRPLPEFYEAVELAELAEKYKKTKAQIVLRYLVGFMSLFYLCNFCCNEFLFDYRLTLVVLSYPSLLDQKDLWRI